MEEKEVSNDEEGEKVEIREEELFQVDRTPIFYTKASRHYQHNPRSKRLNHTGVV